ncbi:MAG: hypothetical protein DRH17_12870 [Deltaproteobacteria bacterium]|nr:MAG: hypothetical protein DRH17_12870 [Deltaproteobacteria bacterium]
MSREIDPSKITLEDVEIAIKIINAFLRKMREAERALRQLGLTRTAVSGYSLSMSDIMSALLKERQAMEEAPVEPPSEEEVKRMRELVKKIESK